MALRLYTYWRSSAAFRVRIALNIKRLDYQSIPKHLVRNGGEQRDPAYLSVNPQGLVPALEHDGAVLAQSLAICEYLEEVAPRPALLPGGPRDRAVVRSMALSIACDVHPLNNLGVQQYLRREFGQGDEAVRRWTHHWIARGFVALEELVARHSADGLHCYGDTVTLADVCLVPQVYNARRAEYDLSRHPRLAAIAASLEQQPAFVAARPEAQPDAE
jgi:maleylacetoacetate isomerase